MITGRSLSYLSDDQKAVVCDDFSFKEGVTYLPYSQKDIFSILSLSEAPFTSGSLSVDGVQLTPSGFSRGTAKVIKLSVNGTGRITLVIFTQISSEEQNEAFDKLVLLTKNLKSSPRNEPEKINKLNNLKTILLFNPVSYVLIDLNDPLNEKNKALWENTLTNCGNTIFFLSKNPEENRNNTNKNKQVFLLRFLLLLTSLSCVFFFAYFQSMRIRLSTNWGFTLGAAIISLVANFIIGAAISRKTIVKGSKNEDTSSRKITNLAFNAVGIVISSLCIWILSEKLNYLASGILKGSGLALMTIVGTTLLFAQPVIGRVRFGLVSHKTTAEYKSNQKTTSIETHSKRNIALGTILGYISLLLSIISGLLFTPWIIQQISDSGYGLYTLTNSIINLFLLDFGLSLTANTFLAKYRAAKNKDGEERFIAVILKLYLFIDLLIFIGFTVVYFLIDYIYVGLTQNERADLKIVFLITAGFSLLSFPATILDGIINAYEEFIFIKIITIFHRLFYIGFTIIALSLNFGLFGLVTGNCLAGFLSIVLKYIFIKRKITLHPQYNWSPPKGFVREIFFFSGWAALASITSRLVFNIMPSILGVVSDSTNISVFSIAATLEGYFYSIASVMGGFFLPKIGRIITNNKGREEIDAFAIKVGKIQLAIFSLLFIGFACAGREFLTLWLGKTHEGDTSIYSPAYWGVLMMSAYHFIFIPEIVIYNEMFLRNKIKHIALSAISKAVINLGLGFLFGWLLGAMGAFISITIARVFELLSLNYYYKKDLQFPIGIFAKKVYLPFLICSACQLAIGLVLHYFLNGRLIYKLIIEISAMLITYVPLCLFTAFRREERLSLIRAVRKR